MDDGGAAGHRLDERVAEAFAQARGDGDPALGIQRRQLLVGQIGGDPEVVF